MIMKPNKRLGKKINICKDLAKIVIKGNFTVALPWNNNSETRNFAKKIDRQE